MFPSITLLLVSLLPIGLHASPSLLPDFIHGGPRVDISHPEATIIGTRKLRIDSFTGIPFAHPPVGSLRLRPPERLTSSLGKIVAKDKPAQCIQMDTPHKDQSEDCLTLNVQRPSSAKAGAKLPVVVWMYGGGFEDGSIRIYNAKRLIHRSLRNGKPIVFAEMNYRLGGFGWLPGKEVLHQGASNLGMLDQRLALQWVADNIAAFGGDPDRVTIMGESAGSISVLNQMAMFDGDHTYKGKPLFRAAVMDSGSIVPSEPVDCKKSQAVYDTVVENAGCAGANDTLGCLREAPFLQYLAAANSVPSLNSYEGLALSYSPRPDGKTLTASPEVLIAKGKYAKVPFIVGDQEDEGTIFTKAQKNITTTEDVVDYLFTLYYPTAPRATVARLVDHYSTNPAEGSPFRTGKKNQIYPQYKRLAALLGDTVFNLQRRRFLDLAHARSPHVPSYSYLASYNYGTPKVGTAHATDIVHIYGLERSFPSASIQNYYLSFFNTMDPNAHSGGQTRWPRWSDGRKLLHFEKDANTILADDFRTPQYRFLVAEQQHVLRF